MQTAVPLAEAAVDSENRAPVTQGKPAPPRRFHLPLYGRVLIAVFFGVVLGLTAGTKPFLFGWGTEELGGLGLLVIKTLRALAVPLVLFAILDAFAHTRISARSGGKLVLICLVNVSVAMGIGLTIMNVVRPGVAWQSHLSEISQAASAKSHATMPSGKNDDPEAPKATLELLPNIAYYVPSALARPFVYNNLISVVLIALLAGAALRRVLDGGSAHHGEEGEAEGRLEAAQTVARFVSGVYQLLVVMLGWVVQVVPFAVFAVVAKVVGASGVGVFAVLWTFLATALAGLFLHSLVYYPLVAWLVGKKPPRDYLGKGADAILTGLSTNSSLATVPITLRCLEKMNVSPASARLAACVGTNLNNDGITLYEAIAALFLAQAVGMNLGLGQQMVVVLASIMAGAGVAGIPEAGLVVLPLVLGAVGLPDATIAVALPLLLPVDWIIARARSGVNVMSDMLVAILLDAGKPAAPAK